MEHRSVLKKGKLPHTLVFITPAAKRECFWECLQACQKMSFPTNDVVLEGQKSAKFWKCRQSFLCRFRALHVVFMSFYKILRRLCRFWGFVLKNEWFYLKRLQKAKKFCLRQLFWFNSPSKVPKVAQNRDKPTLKCEDLHQNGTRKTSCT